MQTTEVRAVIRALDGDIALVEVQQGGCGRCHEEGGCGGHHLTQALCTEPKVYRVANPTGLQIGDEVMIGIPDRAVLIGANFAYVIPVLALIGGAFLGMSVHGDVGAILGGLGGLLLAWSLMRWKMRQGTGNKDFQPRIITSDLIQQETRR